MKNLNLRAMLSAFCLISIFAGFTRVDAGPIGFDQVIQALDARPGKADSANFSNLIIAGSPGVMAIDDDDDDKKKKTPQQDGRVITQTRTEIVDEELCDCIEDPKPGRGFPKWALLGLAAIPIAFIIIKKKKDTPTPTPPGPPMTPTPTPTGTPTGSPTPTPPGMTPTPTPPGMTPTPEMTPTPPVTPTPTPPEPIPEPLTILLFGTGLASVGLAARRKFGKRDEDEENAE